MMSKTTSLLAWIKKHLGLLLVLSFLAVNLATINQYGLTWDFHFHFFGGGKLLGIEPRQLESRSLPYVEPDPRNAWTLPYGPLMSIPPVASFLLIYKAWHVLPADSAYNLPIILWGTAGIAVVYVFLSQAFAKRVALLGALFLALSPRYIGDLHNNMKDIPSAVIFAVNIWLLWRLVKFRRLIDLWWATIAFAAAFNVKINSIFIPIIFAGWLALLLLPRPRPPAASYKLFSLYFLSAPLAAFVLWWSFWPNPIAQLMHAYRTFAIGTNNIEVILQGTWYCSGLNVPWYYPYWYLAITTPLPIVLFFLIGIVTALYSVGKKIFATQRSDSHAHYEIFTLLLLWFFLPLTRYFVPTVGVIDGIRHFEEVLFPMVALAAIAFDATLSLVSRAQKSLRVALIIGVLSWLFWNVIAYHPFEIVYFNEVVGGARGAFGNYDLDYWGSSQKQAVAWINAHAPLNAKIHIVMSADVAGTYLRPDLLQNLNKYGYDESDFVVFLNRQSFYYRFFYAYEYLLRHTPGYTVSVQGAPLVWVFDNRTDNKTPRQTPWWQAEDPCIIKYWRGQRQ